MDNGFWPCSESAKAKTKTKLQFEPVCRYVCIFVCVWLLLLLLRLRSRFGHWSMHIIGFKPTVQTQQLPLILPILMTQQLYTVFCLQSPNWSTLEDGGGNLSPLTNALPANCQMPNEDACESKITTKGSDMQSVDNFCSTQECVISHKCLANKDRQ